MLRILMSVVVGQAETFGRGEVRFFVFFPPLVEASLPACPPAWPTNNKFLLTLSQGWAAAVSGPLVKSHTTLSYIL